MHGRPTSARFFGEFARSQMLHQVIYFPFLEPSLQNPFREIHDWALLKDNLRSRGLSTRSETGSMNVNGFSGIEESSDGDRLLVRPREGRALIV